MIAFVSLHGEESSFSGILKLLECLVVLEDFPSWFSDCDDFSFVGNETVSSRKVLSFDLSIRFIVDVILTGYMEIHLTLHVIVSGISGII